MATYHTTHNAAGGGDGSWASPWTLQEAADNAIAGDTVKVHNTGVYTTAADIDFDTNSGSRVAPIQFIGVGSGETDGPEMVTVRGTADSVPVIDITNRAWLYFENITADADGRAGTGAWYASGGADQLRWVNCKGVNAANSCFQTVDVDNTQFVGCEAYNATTYHGFLLNNPTAPGHHVLVGCVAHHNGGIGFHCRRNSGGFVRCVAYENADRGININNSEQADLMAVVIGCVAWRNGTDGIQVDSHSGSSVLLANNICTENGAYGIEHVQAGATVVMFGNVCPASGAEANVSGGTSGVVAIGNPSSVLKPNLTGSQVADFMDPTSCYPDFRLDTGSDALGAAWPGVLPVEDLCTTTTTTSP